MFGIKNAVKHLLRRYNGFYVNSADIQAKAEYLVSEQGSILDKQGFLQGTDKASIQQTEEYFRISHDYLHP